MSTLSIMNSNANRNSENVSIWSHISSSLLHSWITEKNSQRKLLIIDSRSHSDYEAMHIKDAINVPYSKIIRRKLLNDKISISEILMKNSTSTYLIDEVNIVVYDKHTEHTNQLAEAADQDTDAFVFILLTKIAQKFKSVSFLSGGFVNFQENYSELCSINTSYSRQTSTTPTSPNVSSATGTPSEKTPTTMEPLCIDLNKRFKKHVFNHSISSFDKTNDFFRNTSLNLLKNTYSAIIDTIPSHSGSDSNSPKISNTTPGSPVIREPTKILSYLYLGSQDDALSSATLTALGITNVLNVSINCPKPEFIPDANFLRISVNDGHAAKIRPFFDVAYRFIEKCRKANTKVLIHCLAGISRSPTLAIAYLMRHLGLSSDDAYKFVKEKRPSISPNFNFLGQLYEYDKFLKQQRAISEAATEQTSSGNATSVADVSVEQPINQADSNEKSSRFRLKATQSLLKFNTKLKSSATANLPLNNHNQLTSPSTDLPECIEADNTQSMNTPKQLFMSNLRRKQFIFPFSSNNPDENMPSSVQLNLVQSTQSTALASPSQAFSNFNLNSPTVSHKSITDNNTNNTHSSISSSCSSTNSKELKQHSHLLAKSFTSVGFESKMLSFHNQRPTELVMHRPTNLLMDSLTTSHPNKTPEEPTKSFFNSLKRPSSIVFEAKKPNLTMINNKVSPVSNTTEAATSDYPFLVNPQKFNKVFSNNNSTASGQIGSSVCSCSPSFNSRSSSSMSMVSPTSLGTISKICNSCSNPPTLQKKKIKLSPVKDRCTVMNTFQMTQ